MPIPEFITELRARIGTAPLWLPGVSAVVTDDDARVLVTRRADTGAWALPSGIPDPGEQMAQACRREVLEETGVGVEIERLISVWTQPAKVYPNGDHCQFVDHAFACRATGGNAHVADDENLEVRWFAVGDLPVLPPRQRENIELARQADPVTWFER